MSNISGFTDWNIGIDDKDYKKKSKPLTKEQLEKINARKKNTNFGETLYGETIYGETIYNSQNIN